LNDDDDDDDDDDDGNGDEDSNPTYPTYLVFECLPVKFQETRQFLGIGPKREVFNLVVSSSVANVVVMYVAKPRLY